MYLRVTVTSKI